MPLTLDQRLESLVGGAAPAKPDLKEKAYAPSTELDRRLEFLIPSQEKIAYPEVKPELLGAARQAMTTPPTQYPFEATIPIATPKTPELDFKSLAQVESPSQLRAWEPSIWERIKGYFYKPMIEPRGYEGPFTRGAKLGLYNFDKFLTGAAGGIPEIERTVEQRYQEDLDFYPTPKEQNIGNMFQFYGGIRTAGKIINFAAKQIPTSLVRQSLKTILGAGLTFGLRRADEEFVEKLRTGKPVDWQGIHFEAGLGELFGAGEVGINTLKRFIQGVRAGKAIVPYQAPSGTKEAHRVAIRKEIQTALNARQAGDRTKWDTVRLKYSGAPKPGEQVAEAVKPTPTAPKITPVEAVELRTIAEPTVTAPKAVGEKIPSRPMVNPKATAMQRDKQLLAQQSWDRKYGVAERERVYAEADKNNRRIVLESRAKRGEPIPTKLLQEFTGEEWADKVLAKQAPAVAPIVPTRKTLTELEQEIQRSDIYQMSIEAQGIRAEEVGGGVYYIPKKLAGEVRDAIANYPLLKFHITSDPTKGADWTKVVQEGLLRRVGDTTGEMDISEFLSRLAESVKSRQKLGKLNAKALDVMARSREPYQQILAIKYEMMKQGFASDEINGNIREIAIDNGISEVDISPLLVKGEQYVREKQKVVGGMEKEIRPPEKVRPKDLIGRPILEGGATGAQAEFLEKERYRLAEPDIEGQMKIPPVGKPGLAVVPKFLQGRPGLGLKLYQDIFNRFAAIEDVTKKAMALGMKVQPGEDPGKRARGYLGIAGKAQSILEDKTFKIIPEGKIEITGEGLKPILNDYESQGKVLGKPEGLLKTNFKEYLKATRTIEDLQRPPYEGAKREIVTPKQVEEAKNTLTNLKKQYGENIPILQNAAKRLYDYQSRILHLLVDSGNLSEEQYQNILKVNQFYVPFDRIMDDIEPTGVSPVSKRRFTGARAPVKRIKGSEREIYDPIESVVKNTYRILDAAERNTVARNVARLGEVLPEAIKPVEIPIVPLAKVPLKAGIDPKLTAELLSVIDTLKGEYERKLKIGGKRMGYFKPKRQVVTRFGTSEGVIAHELGHYIDELYGLKEKLVKNPETIKELRALADLRQVRRAYARKGEEKIAALMDAFVTKPFILDDVAPNSKRILTSIINEHEELKPLLKIRPSMEVQYEKAIQTIFGQSPFKPKGNIIEYFENGKRKYIEVSPELYQAMSGMNEVSSSLFIQLLSKPAQWLRVGATMTPEFAFRNPLRDQWTAFMQTNVGFIPLVDTGRAIADILGKSQVYYDYLRSGGAQSGFVEMTRPALQKAVKELNRHPDLIKRLNIITDMQDLSQLMERGTRVGVYKAGIRKGLTPVEAGFVSRESTLDFARRGAKTRDVNKVIAFLNAGIQALDATVRTFAKRPVSTTLKGIASITIPSLLLYLKNRKDPEYKEIPTWKRDLFWITRVGDTYVGIPKPFLYGQVFGSIPERFFEYLDTKDKSAFDGLAKSTYESLSPVTGDPAGGLLATAVKPLVENYVNWNFFLGRKIIPEGKERFLPPEQYGRYTSDTAKRLGEIFGYSPAKIENLARGWFGGTAQYALGASDYLLNSIRKEAGVKIPEKPKEFEQMPLIRGFTIKPPTETGQAESIEKFYDMSEKITSVYLTADRMVKENRIDDAKRLILAHPEVKNYQFVSPTVRALSELNQAVDNILKDPNMPSKIKEEKISRIQKARVKLVQKVNQELKK